MNGVANVAANCTACHGTAGRPVTATNPLLDSAPPVAPAGTDPARVVGTHLLHLQDGTIRAGVACNNCHVIPANADHSIQFPPRIVVHRGDPRDHAGRVAELRPRPPSPAPRPTATATSPSAP